VYTQMKLWTQVRQYVLVDGHSKREACRKFNIHWDTLKKMLAHPQPPGYTRSKPKPAKKIDRWLPVLHRWLEEDRQAPPKQRHTRQQIYRRLVKEHHFDGRLTIVKDAVRAWRKVNAQTFVPLADVKPEIDRLTERRHELDKQIAQAQRAMQRTSEDPEAQADQIIERIASLDLDWSILSPAMRRDLVQQFIEKVEIDMETKEAEVSLRLPSWALQNGDLAMRLEQSSPSQTVDETHSLVGIPLAYANCRYIL
jgi:transposase